MKRLILIPVIFTLLALPLEASEHPSWPTPSVWELVEVSPVTMFDSNPRGWPNQREFYTAEGELCLLQPHETFPEIRRCVDVTFSDDQRLVSTPDGKQHSATIVDLSATNAVLDFPDGSRFEYRRIEDDGFEVPIRPHSLHVLQVSSGPQIRASDVHYVEPPQNGSGRSLVGVWEEIEHRNVPYRDLPPYGFPNMKWVFDDASVAAIAADAVDVPANAGAPYTREGEWLIFGDSEERLGISFNRWGDLELKTPSGTIVLRQLTDDPQDIEAIPAKVTLLIPADE